MFGLIKHISRADEAFRNAGLRAAAALAFLTAFVAPGVCQDAAPKGRFMADSVRTGEIAAYVFSFRYPAEKEAVFPDSNYNYYPFEFIRKEFFPTRTNAGVSFDSAVYYLASYEALDVLPLSLPVIVLENGDSVAYFSEPDTLIFKATVTAMPDSIQLKESTAYLPVRTTFNYIHAALATLIVLAVAGVAALLFGKQIRRAYRLYKLKKDYVRYIGTMSRLLENINGDASIRTGHALIEWKKYLERLDNKPLTKLTTKEISRIYCDKAVEESLRGIDRALYGNVVDERLKEWLERLVDYSKERYRNKTEEVKHV